MERESKLLMKAMAHDHEVDQDRHIVVHEVAAGVDHDLDQDQEVDQENVQSHDQEVIQENVQSQDHEVVPSHVIDVQGHVLNLDRNLALEADQEHRRNQKLNPEADPVIVKNVRVRVRKVAAVAVADQNRKVDQNHQKNSLPTICQYGLILFLI